MCFSTSSWKREVVPDHKFDFVDTREFTDNGCGMRMKYLWLYVIVLKSFMVYVSDIFTAVTMLTTDSWSNAIFNGCQNESNGCVYIPFDVGKWLFFGCIIFSFLLLAYEAYKTKKIIASRDISYAFTNVMANHYYSLRSYDHFCFFDHISNSTKRIDDFAFFVFFTFKSWKRLLFADGPRQAINALTLYAVYLSKESKGPWYDISKYFDGNTVITSALTVSTIFTVVIYAGSLLLLIVAAVCYIPLLCHIQGNLKEYCCHKVDKRISEIIKRRNKQRLVKATALARKEAAGDYSHLKNKKGELIAKPLPQPTLPNISLDDDFDDAASIRTRGPPPSTMTAKNDYYFNDRKAAAEYVSEYPADYPPMPAYNAQYNQQPDPYYPHNPPAHDDSHLYENEYGSTAHLTSSAAPMARTDTYPPAIPDQYLDQHNYANVPYRQATPVGEPVELQRGPTPSPAYSREQYAYDMQDYPSPTSSGPPPPPSFAEQASRPYQGQDTYAYHDEKYDYSAGQGHAM